MSLTITTTVRQAGDEWYACVAVGTAQEVSFHPTEGEANEWCRSQLFRLRDLAARQVTVIEAAMQYKERRKP
jgi:hypothetical protein